MGVMRKDELQKLQNVRKVELSARSILSHPDSMAKGKRKKRKKEKGEREKGYEFYGTCSFFGIVI